MQLSRQIYYALTPKLRLLARRILFLPYDVCSRFTRKGDELVPPRGMIYIGSGDFVKQGKRLMQLLIEHTGLTPQGSVLDIGCGIGRLAAPLTKYLDKEGRYEGFDVVKTGIDWCNENIAARYPNFHFVWVSLKNDLYNLDTNKESTSFAFPYPASSFDSIVLTSVFTHMMPDDVTHYLREISKVLRPGGKCMTTFFIINGNIKEKMKNGLTKFKFKYPYEGYYLMDKKVKEANVAYDEATLLRTIGHCGLKVESMHRGGWTGEKDALDFQDVMILSKK